MPLPRVTIECRAVDDPELRFTPSGAAVANLRLVAQDRRRNPQTNEWEDGDTLWINGSCWRQTAENVAESVAKGDLLLVTGRLKTRNWEDKEGNKRSNTELDIDEVGVSLRFRTVPHGGKAQRSQAGQSSQPAADPWASNPSDDPPF